MGILFLSILERSRAECGFFFFFFLQNSLFGPEAKEEKLFKANILITTILAMAAASHGLVGWVGLD